MKPRALVRKYVELLQDILEVCSLPAPDRYRIEKANCLSVLPLVSPGCEHSLLDV